MSTRTILLAGATGLIGDAALHLALDDPRFGHVVVLARRSTGLQHPKLEEWISPDLLQGLRPKTVDAVLCCLGTTIGKEGGDKARFIHVDKDLVLGLGAWAKEQGVPVFAVVSAIGADASSRIFYNRVKGEMEVGLKALGLPTLHIFHPSILVGPRKEFRLGERTSAVVMKAIAPLLPAKARPMPHDVLAKALLNAVLETQGGTHRYREIRALAKA
ncbi:MAG: NAD-dependent dehydratase [Flavobacteriales bacterium]|nr:NAD-dependent dehydratase [Flavobacteriales bacterium]